MRKEERGDGRGKCYDDVVGGLKWLRSKGIELERKDGLCFGGLVKCGEREGGEGIIYLSVEKFVWEWGLEFRKGLRKVDLVVGMELK